MQSMKYIEPDRKRIHVNIKKETSEFKTILYVFIRFILF